jgi:hypothetical protein
MGFVTLITQLKSPPKQIPYIQGHKTIGVKFLFKEYPKEWRVLSSVRRNIMDDCEFVMF